MSDSGPPTTPERGSRASVDPPSSDGIDTLPAVRARTVDKIPRVFGRYRIQDCLGRGGMGAVFRAVDTQLDRTVALKVPFLDNDDPDLRQRFYREARAAAALHHPNICPVFDVGEQDGIPYLTMAFIEGRSLAQLLEAGHPFTPQQIALLVRKLALAMQQAHTRGVIHRDLKPSNVVLRPNGEPVVMDFGLARRTDDRSSEGLTRKGDVIGTLEYMSPEQLDGDNEVVGPAADVYALGVVLYEMLAGRRPFTGNTASKLAAILLKPPPRPSEVRPGVPSRLEEICLTAMARRLEDRYPSMGQFATALTEYLRSPDTSASPAAARPAENPSDQAPATPAPVGSTRPIKATAVRSPEPAPAEAEADTPAPPAVKSSSGPRRSRTTARRKKTAKKSNRPVLIGGAGVGVLGLIVVAVLLWPRGKPSVVQAPVSGSPAGQIGGSAPPTAHPEPVRQPPPQISATNPGPGAKTPPAGPSSPAAKAPPAPAPRPTIALHCPPDGVTLAIGEQREVTVEVQSRGLKGPVEVRWTGPKEVRVSPHGPLTVRPGGPNPVLTLQLMAEPTTGPARVDFTATPAQESRVEPGVAHLTVKPAPGPCVRVVDVTGRPDAGVGAMAFTPDASLALVGGAEKQPGEKPPAGEKAAADDRNTIRVWNLSRVEPLSPLAGHTGRVTELTVAGDGKTALSVSADDTVALWDLVRGRRASQSPKQSRRVLAAAVSPDAKLGLAVYPGLIVKVNLEQFQAVGMPIKTAPLTGSDLDDSIRAVAVSADRKGLAGGVDGKLFLLDLTDRAKPKPLAGHREAVLCAAFAPVGRMAATGGGGVLQVGTLQPGRENVVCVWDLAGPSLRWKAEGHTRPVVCVAFSPDGQLVASGGAGGEVRVWAAADGKPVATFAGHAGQVLALAFTPDGKSLWSGSADRTLRQWQLP